VYFANEKAIKSDDMIKQFERLTDDERSLLFKAPVLVSVLASCSHNGVNAHIKTYTSAPLLRSYYVEVEKNFKDQFEDLANKYSPFDETKRNELKREISKINLIVGKLDKEYGQLLCKSFEKYAKHVKRATHSVFQDFLFPMPVAGFND
jgi:hypothetical protein